MTAYAGFARFYDEVMGDRGPWIERIQGYIGRHMPGAGSLLELGCGTGALLAGLTGDLSVTGVDRSPEMLAIAARTVPGARLVQADITSFSLGVVFDVVICVFDTLNHVPTFGGWTDVFDRVHTHLADGGLFVFDVNTAGRLRRLEQAPAYVEEIGQHTMIMDVTPGGDGRSLWEVRIFERTGGDQFRLHRDQITELGVPLARVREALAAHFDLLEATDADGAPATDESSRAYFACRHRGDAGSPP